MPADRPEPPPPGVSLSMIVRDEEANLDACLATVADLVDELIVVDTGSVDDTVAVAERRGARVVRFPWVDDFAAARNAGLDAADRAWVLWLDADDRLDQANRDKLRTLLAGLRDDNAAYVFRQRNRLDQAPGEPVVFDRIHLFRNRPDVRWERRVHEQILPAIERTGAEVRWADVAFEHSGYAEQGRHRGKAERNLRLLRIEAAERPGDAFTQFNLAWTLHSLGREAEALPCWEASLAASPPTVSYLRKLYALWSRDLHALGRPAEALAVCREGTARFADDVELLFLEALLLREAGDPAGAEAALRRLLAAEPAPYLSASVNLAIRARKAPHQLAESLVDQGRDAEAETHWRRLLDAEPGFVPAWAGLGVLYVKHGQLAAAEAIAARLAGLPDGAEAVGRLRALVAEATTPLDPAQLETAEAAWQSGRFVEAERRFRALADRPSLRGLALYRLATIANHRGEFAEAWNLHRQALAADPRLAAKITPTEFRHHGVVVRPVFDVEPGGPCRVCGSAEAEPIAAVNGLALNSYHAAIDPVRRWVRCRVCGHGYADPRPGPSALGEAYAEPPPDHLRQWTYEQMIAWDEIVRGLASHGAGPGWLDAGAGSCGLSAVAREHGYRPTALDLNPAQAEWAARLGIEFLRGDLGEIDLGGRMFDLIALGDVIEHLPEPAAALRRLAGSLAAGGLLWISTPNRQGAWARALGDRDPMWLETEHLHYFTKASLDRLLADLGFAAIDFRLSRRYRGCMELTARRVGDG